MPNEKQGRRLKVAACQMDPKLNRIDRNLERIDTMMGEAIDRGAELTVFPECAVCGYCHPSREAAETVALPAESDRFAGIQARCAESGVWCAVGFLEWAGEDVFNSVRLFGPDGELRCFRKMHLPFLGVDRFVRRGDRGFPVFETAIGRIGVNVCYDQRFPESARAAMLGGAQLLLVPTNEPEEAREVCDLLTRARAFENHLFYLWVNRVGEEAGTRFMGASQLIAPSGEVLFRLSEDREEIGVAEIDLTVADAKRIVCVPGEYEIDLLADRRPESYAALVNQVAAGGGGGGGD